MKKKYSSLIKNIGLFTLGSFGSKIVAFLMLPLYTALLTTNDYGIVDLLQSSAQLLIPILLLSIQDAILRFGMDTEFNKEDVISTAIKITINGTIILFLGILILNILNIFNISIIYWTFLFLTFLFSALNNSFTIYLKSKNQATIIAVSGILCTFATCFSNFVCLVILKMGINGYMISNIIGIFIQLIYQFIIGKIYKDIHIKEYNNLSKPMIKYSSPLIANSIAWWINNASDRYILTWISGIAINGIYAIAYKIPTILTTFQNIFYNAWSISAITEFNKDDEDGFIGNNYTLYSFISIFICSLILLFNIPIAKILYSGEYFSAWKYVPFLLVGTVFNGIAQFEGSLFAASKRTREVSITTFLGAILNTICNFIFIYLWGALGAALATMAGYFLTWVLRTLFLQNFIKMKVKWKIHFLSVFLLICQSIFTTLNIVYIIQLLIFGMILILHAKYLKKIFDKLIKKY